MVCLGEGWGPQGALERGRWGSGHTRWETGQMSSFGGRGERTFLLSRYFSQMQISSVISSVQKLRTILPCTKRGVSVSLGRETCHPKTPTRQPFTQP